MDYIPEIRIASSRLTLYMLLSVALFVVYCLVQSWGRPEVKQKSLGEKTNPPDYHSVIPVVGNVISMAWSAPGLLTSVINSSKGVPVRLRLLMTDFYVVSGSENIKAVWKSSDLHVRAYKTLAVQNMFKMPRDTLDFWLSDDSGINADRHPASKVPPHLRIEHLTYSSVHKFLTGPGLKPFAERFTVNLLNQLNSKKDISSEWRQLDDLFSLVEEEFLNAALTAMCGEELLKINPTFVKDYWDLNRALYILAKGYPRWMCPGAYKVRDRCLSSLKKWHRFIQPYLSDPSLSNQDWNPYYGTEIVKFRHVAWSRMDRMNADAAATEDLGMIWAANGNSVPASFWMLAEVLKRPSLLAQVQQRVEAYRVNNKDGLLDFDWTALCNDPLLQSIYAETMRLRVASFLFRSPDRKPFQLGRWLIPEDGVMLISGFNAQMDKKIWEKEGARPVEEFWAERFLEPCPPPERVAGIAGFTGIHNDSQGLGDFHSSKFSLEGRATAWLPYGGGQRMCPGRHFNKQEMITGLAIMITVFDMELLNDSRPLPESDMRGFGFGALLPGGKTPVRIRRSGREQNHVGG